LPFILGDSYVNELTRLVLLDPVPDKTVTRYVALRFTQALPSFQKVQYQLALELEAEPPIRAMLPLLQAGPKSIGV